MTDDLQHRYSYGKVKTMIDIACFINPRFKGNFSQNKDDTIRSIVEGAVNLAETTSLPREEWPATTADQEQGSSTYTTTAPSAATKKNDKYSVLLAEKNYISKTTMGRRGRCVVYMLKSYALPEYVFESLMLYAYALFIKSSSLPPFSHREPLEKNLLSVRKWRI